MSRARPRRKGAVGFDRGRVGVLIDTFPHVLRDEVPSKALVAWLHFGVRIGIVPRFEELKT